MSTLSLQQKEKTAQLGWTVFILGFFAIQAVIWTIAITITANDSSQAVVAGYRDQALSWDDVKKSELASASLGWSFELKVEQPHDLFGNRKLSLSLSDRAKKPVENASVELQAFHRGQAAQVQRVKLTSMAPGEYVGELRVTRPGIWIFSGNAIQGQQKFLIDHRQKLFDNMGN